MSFTANNNLSVLGYGAKFANYVTGVPIFGKTDPRDFDPAVDRYFGSGSLCSAAGIMSSAIRLLRWIGCGDWTQKAESIALAKSLAIK